MRDTDGTTRMRDAGPVLQRLLHEGWDFDFFKAVWLLERYCSDRAPIGARGPVSAEAIRLRPHVSLGFPASDVRRIAHCEDPSGGEPYFRIDSTFLGLYGVATPLPLHYAIDVLRAASPLEDLADETSSDHPDEMTRGSESAPARDFLDIFHHRILSLFYRAWTKYRYDVSFGLPGRNNITEYFLYLIGCSPKLDGAALGVFPIRLLRYAGLLTQHPTSAIGIEGMLTDYWGEIEVRVEQFVGRWVPLAAGDMNQIGFANSRPGEDLIIGELVYDLNGAFNIVMGPVAWETYLYFLPLGEGFAQTRALVMLACSDPLAFTLEIRILQGQVPEMQLYSDDRAARLGYTSWVRTEELSETSVVFDATSPPPMESRMREREEAVAERSVEMVSM